jgi:predicted nucleotidyltransferase
LSASVEMESICATTIVHNQDGLHLADETWEVEPTYGTGEMISQETIQSVVDDIVRTINPHKVILFGSYARGTPTSDSDIDLFVVATIGGTASERIRKVRRAITARGFGLDVVVRSPEQVEKSLSGRDWFVQEVYELGKVVYERRN